jgi:hypothetical protein
MLFFPLPTLNLLCHLFNKIINKMWFKQMLEDPLLILYGFTENTGKAGETIGADKTGRSFGLTQFNPSVIGKTKYISKNGGSHFYIFGLSECTACCCTMLYLIRLQFYQSSHHPCEVGKTTPIL